MRDSRVQSFGRPQEPDPEPEMMQGVPFPIIQLPVVPVIDPAAIEAVAQQIQSRIAEAVRTGFADGFADAAAFIEAADADEEDAAADVPADAGSSQADR